MTINISEWTACHDCGVKWHYIVEGKTYSRIIGVEYEHGSPERYDGVSEWRCPFCGTRWGRWSGKILQPNELEKRFGGY